MYNATRNQFKSILIYGKLTACFICMCIVNNYVHFTLLNEGFYQRNETYSCILSCPRFGQMRLDMNEEIDNLFVKNPYKRFALVDIRIVLFPAGFYSQASSS